MSQFRRSRITTPTTTQGPLVERAFTMSKDATMGRKPHAGHTDRAWRAMCKRVLASSNLCGICGEPIDFNAPPRTPLAPSVDCIVPVSHGGSTTDRTNLRPAHFGCNSKRGNDPAPPALPHTRDW